MKTREILTIIGLSCLGLCLLLCLLKMSMKDKKGQANCDKVCGMLFFAAAVLIGVSQLLKETSDSIEIAMNIRNIISNANIEIHADVNSENNHNSNKYKNMVSGYITGCGFSVKVKPESFVASSIADNHTRKS